MVNAVRYWRDALPRGHRVDALVVVYPTAEGDLALPATVAEELAWTRACDAVRTLRARLPRGQHAGGRRTRGRDRRRITNARPMAWHFTFVAPTGFELALPP